MYAKAHMICAYKTISHIKRREDMDNFKYTAIVDWAKDYIKTNGLKPDDRFLTEKELCTIHGVSRQTVRQAMMTLERENIISRVRGSGTFVTERAAGIAAPGAAAAPAKKIVGVISTYFSDYIFPHIVTGIESVLGDRGYTMQLSITHDQVLEETQALENMLSSGVCGLIVEPSKSALPNPNTELYNKIRASGIPLVFFNAKYQWADFPYAAMDDTIAGKKVTDHLFDCGHRDIAGIFALDDIQGHKRYSGFMQSCLEHNVSDAEKNVFWFLAADKSKMFTFGKDKLLELFDRTTGVVCYNDMVAINLMKFCKENAIRVPEDLSVVGIDDSRYASICEVPLTSVHHPHKKLGATAAKMLISMIENKDISCKDEIFEPELIVRDSVRKL